MIPEIDVQRLIGDARNSCCKESYLVLHKDGILRIGTGARLIEKDLLLFFDISITLCPGVSHLNTKELDKAMSLAKRLSDIGFNCLCYEGQINCDKDVAMEKMNSEYKAIQYLINELGF